MDFARHAADLHGEILGASYRPIGSTVSTFHLDAMFRVNVGADFFGEVAADDDDLRPGVEDPMYGADIAD
jgi:hypothetical protein